MQVLLNISTHPSDLAVIDHDWSLARAIRARHGFDGYELYPVQGYPFDEIPADLIHGLHLPFFPIIEPCWHERHERLMEKVTYPCVGIMLDTGHMMNKCIARLFDLIEPEYVVFEFSYRSREEWGGKIQQQSAACAGVGRSVRNPARDSGDRA